MLSGMRCHGADSQTITDFHEVWSATFADEMFAACSRGGLWEDVTSHKVDQFLQCKVFVSLQGNAASLRASCISHAAQCPLQNTT